MRVRPFVFVDSITVAGACYTRRDAWRTKKTLPDRCNGAYLPGVLRADGADECAQRNAHESAVSIFEHRAADFEGLRTGLRGHRLRYQATDVPRQTV